MEHLTKANLFKHLAFPIMQLKIAGYLSEYYAEALDVVKLLKKVHSE